MNISWSVRSAAEHFHCFQFGISVITSKVEDFSCLLAIWFFLFCEWPVQTSAHFSVGKSAFFLLICRSSLYTRHQFFVFWIYQRWLCPVCSCCVLYIWSVLHGCFEFWCSQIDQSTFYAPCLRNPSPPYDFSVIFAITCHQKESVSTDFKNSGQLLQSQDDGPGHLAGRRVP